MKKVVLGVVDSQAQAEAAVKRLAVLGISSTDVSVLFPDRRGTHDFGLVRASRAAEGACIGGAGGVVLGATLGGVGGLGLLAFAGLGLLAAAGPMLSSLAGASALGIPLAIAGALVGATVTEIEVRPHAGKRGRGGILLAVHVERRRDLRLALAVMRSVAADDIGATDECPVPVTVST